MGHTPACIKFFVTLDISMLGLLPLPVGLSATLTAASAPPPAAALRLGGSDKPTVWSEFGALAAENPGAVNLGQGFPDWSPPDFVVAEAHAALDQGFHQYTRPAGHPSLASVLASRYSRHLGREVDAMTEVAITVGASQALFLTLQVTRRAIAARPPLVHPLQRGPSPRPTGAARPGRRGDTARARLRPLLRPNSARGRYRRPCAAAARRAGGATRSAIRTGR